MLQTPEVAHELSKRPESTTEEYKREPEDLRKQIDNLNLEIDPL
jgi:hypothetical protein